MSKFLYPIYKLKTKSYIKWWLYHKKAGGSGILSEILQGFSFNLENTLNRKFKLFEIEGNSDQETTEGKNLCPTKSFESLSKVRIVSNNTEYGKTVQGIPVSVGTYTASFDVTTLPSLDYRIQLVASSDSTQSQSANDITNPILTVTNSFSSLGRKTLSIAVEQSCYLYLRCVPVGFGLDNIQIEQGSATDYEPYTGGIASPNPNYEQPIKSAGDNGSINEKITNSDGTKEQTYSIPTQQPMRSIGDVRDCFVKKSDGWYERHFIGEVVINGTEEVYLYNDNGSRAVFYINVADLYDYTNSAETPELLSNRFRPVSQTATWEPGGIACRIGGRAIFFIFETGTTVNDFKNWLSAHNVVVQYKLAEPLDLPCTPEQVEQIENKPSTYKDYTIIQSEDETPAHLKIQYYKEG